MERRRMWLVILATILLTTVIGQSAVTAAPTMVPSADAAAPGRALHADTSRVTGVSAEGAQRLLVLPRQKVTYRFVVGSAKEFISVNTQWPVGDVPLTLVSPSGRRIDRLTSAADVTRETQPTREHLEVAAPEDGTWTAELLGEDVSPAGQIVRLDVYQADVRNKAPTGRIVTRIEGDSLVLDASGSTDPDGHIVSYDWYVSTPQQDTQLQGAIVKVPLAAPSERSFDLVVTDDRAGKGFAGVLWLLLDVMPGSAVNAIELTSAGVTPMALLSTATFDATLVVPTTLRFGPGAARATGTTVRREDVNGDGRVDQVLHVETRSLGLTAKETQLCVTGALPKTTKTFSSCDRVRPTPTSAPTTLGAVPNQSPAVAAVAVAKGSPNGSTGPGGIGLLLGGGVLALAGAGAIVVTRRRKSTQGPVNPY